MRSERERLLQDGPVYGVVSRALWALAPLLVLLMALGIPIAQMAQRQNQAMLEREIAAENHRFCEKWGMPADTPEHAVCVRDLVGIRARAEQRVLDEFAAADF